MSDDNKVKIIVEKRAEANLRKLARALIALAEQKLNPESSTDDKSETSS